jgi:Na+/melibiose symporter-like transporter
VNLRNPGKGVVSRMSEAVSDLDVASDSSIEPSLNSADEEANVNESLVAESERSSGEDEKGEESSALPWKQIIPLCLVQLCETFSSSGVFTYAGFLVKDFTGKPIDQAGTLAGFLPSAAYFGMFLGGMPWGYLSDRFGKRVCLLLGTIGSTVCALGLGFSQNLLMAILFRFLSGLLNGNLGIVKSYLGAISNSKNQGRAFSLIAIVWGAGCV